SAAAGGGAAGGGGAAADHGCQTGRRLRVGAGFGQSAGGGTRGGERRRRGLRGCGGGGARHRVSARWHGLCNGERSGRLGRRAPPPSGGCPMPPIGAGGCRRRCPARAMRNDAGGASMTAFVNNVKTVGLMG